jgi:hypothetical protein
MKIGFTEYGKMAASSVVGQNKVNDEVSATAIWVPWLPRCPRHEWTETVDETSRKVLRAGKQGLATPGATTSSVGLRGAG